MFLSSLFNRQARHSLLGLLAAVFAVPGPLHAAPTTFELRGSQLTGPAQLDPGQQEWFAKMNNWKKDTGSARGAWLAELRAWREQQLARINYSGAQYLRPDLAWTQRNFVQPQVMVEDRYFYDPVARRYTVDRLLDDLELRYGGVDSVLLWPVYPNIGVDNRNQWDLPRDLPGGPEAIRAMVADFHRRGVRVFLPTMPWDTGTRDPGCSHAEATAKLIAEFGVDGVNGDTCDGLTHDHRLAQDALRPGVALEPELSMREDSMLEYNQQSWAYWEYPFVPMVSKWKWLEPRHLINVCDRWARDRTDLMQSAFFNGVGVESWENIWGYWNQFTERDGEALRRISTVYRAFPEHLVSAGWTPHVPTLRYGAYASSFPLKGSELWTLVNRGEYDLSGALLEVDHKSGREYFDLWNGRRLTPRVAGDKATLDLSLEPRGYGAVLAVDAGSTPSALEACLTRMAQLSSKPLASFSAVWRCLPQKQVPIAATAPAAIAPKGMVRIPGGDFDFRVTGIGIEGENREGLDVQYPWENSPRRGHSQRMTLRPFHIDRHPVTNADYKVFLEATRYQPADAHNFLRHWVDGRPPVGAENSPVIWVSLEDARAYAAWAGKRLPHEWEWQYAAQGTDGRVYPWGNDWDASAVPEPQKGRAQLLPPAVGAHPKGASPFGVEDLVGLVWQWTDEYVDERTRAAVLRGGSCYTPQNSFWYFPQAYKLSEHGKYLLMAPAKDRSGTIGFRCVQDAP